MELLKFDQKLLLADIERLPVPFRVLFAAVSAERQFPQYTGYSLTRKEDAEALRAILNRLWHDLEAEPMGKQKLQQCITLTESLILDENELPFVGEREWAGNAVVALYHALRCRRSGEAKEAMWSALRATDGILHFTRGQKKYPRMVPGEFDKMMSHPLIQAEMRRQRRDLDELLAADEKDVAQIAERMRERAKDESEIFFGVKNVM